MKDFKQVKKMDNPSVIVSTAFKMTDVQWEQMYKTIGIVTNKLSEKFNLPLVITMQDLKDNLHKCTEKEHELTPFKNNEKKCYICVHCLSQFSMADLNDDKKEHFFSALKEKYDE